MARQTTTVHVCDSCGKQFRKPGDLRKFAVTLRRKNWEHETTDLCADCEVNFLAAAVPFFAESSDFSALSRGAE